MKKTSGASLTVVDDVPETMNGDAASTRGDRGVTFENPSDHVVEYVASENGDATSVRSEYARSVRGKPVSYKVRRPHGVSDSRKGFYYTTPKWVYYVVGGLLVGLFIFIISMSSLITEEVNLGRKFNIYTRKCHMPDIDPYHESIREYLKPAEPIECTNLPPLTFTARRQDGRQVLHVDMANVGRYARSSYGIGCCYSVITRVDDVEFSVGKCIDFKEEAILERTTEFLIVKCNDSQYNTPLYANMHAVVQRHEGSGVSLPTAVPRTNITSQRRKKRDPDTITSEDETVDNTIIENESYADDIEEKDTLTESSITSTGIPPIKMNVKVPERPSVLLLGIDSMSRNNLQRTMPQTLKYLRANDWIDFVGFNKVGVNTAPNLVAAFSGNNQEQSYDMGCWPPQTGHVLDKCPFIWREFKRRGYTTSYAEDTCDTSSSFRYPHASGFNEKPFDYYLRPFMVAAEKLLPTQIRDESPVCLGPTPTMDHVVNYTLDVLKTHVHDPVFVFNWLNHFSHNNHITPSAVDGKFVSFLENLSGIGEQPFNDAIVIFFSDHGIIFGNLSKTEVGWYETRLPMLYVWVPKWFKVGYPYAYNHLRNNAAKLVSPYDLYLTLKDIVDGRIGKLGKGSAGCRSCGSLFYPVVADRGCKEAGIPEEWCTCKQQAPTSIVGKLVQNAPELVVNHINEELVKNNLSDSTCAVLKFNSVISARLKENTEPQPYIDFVIVFDALPGSMTYDTTVRYFRATKTSKPKYQLIGKAQRVDSYAYTGRCMELKEFKPYCYCL